jgi:hypothetical protein
MGLVKTIEISPDETDGEDREISTYLTRVIQAKCSNCRLRETAQPDILKRAVELFTQRGWKVRGTKLLCKECVKLWE